MKSGDAKLIIFDADGTLRRCVVEGQPCPNADDEWELLPDVRNTIQSVVNMRPDVYLAIASNQGGVDLGYIAHDAASAMLTNLGRAAFPNPYRGKRHWLVTMCPHRPDAGCECRKPRPGMLQRLMRAFEVDPGSTLYVGDLDSDSLAARAAGCRFQWAWEFFDWTDPKLIGVER